MRIVAYSLFGRDSKYWRGVPRVLRSVKTHLSDFTPVFYVSKDISLNEEPLQSISASEIRQVDEPENWASTSWRFRASEIKGVEALLFRDTDSLVSPKEEEQVRLWLHSSRDVMVIRDHPFHKDKALAGLFGIKGASIEAFRLRLLAYNFGDHYGTDQEFLTAFLENYRAEDIFFYTSFHAHESQLGPTGRLNLIQKFGGFMGESFTSPLPTRIFARLSRLFANQDCTCPKSKGSG